MPGALAHKPAEPGGGPMRRRTLDWHRAEEI
jgi:hypothetical protein